MIPRVAWTWYVLIGAMVTFAVGLGASAVLRKRARVAVAAVVLVGMVVVGSLGAQTPPVRIDGWDTQVQGSIPRVDGKAVEPGAPDFAAVSAAINKAIGEKKLPGAVLVVGHGGKVVFEEAYGVRKYAGEPGLDGKPSAAEPMTVDTIFDMASLTKCLVTATAVMQLVEQGKVDVDAPVVKYLPEFGVNGKEKVTVRELLTHYSGLPEDVNLKDAWGLAAPDKAEGIKRAMNAELRSVPGTKFVYSDINFITLGALVEKVSGETLDVYAAVHIFNPLGMKETRYLAFDKVCGMEQEIPVSVRPEEFLNFIRKKKPSVSDWEIDCGRVSWTYKNWAERAAPTQHDDQGTKETNPDFDQLLRAVVHDPTTRRMGGVAGHAGVFSTAEDVACLRRRCWISCCMTRGRFR